MMRPPVRRPIAAQINMTPMIDVTFQLIIFFLLSSHLAQQETQMDLELPTAASGRTTIADTRPRLAVNVSTEGRITLGSAATEPNDVARRLTMERERLGDDLEIRIRSDRSVPYSAVEPILLGCADAGIWNVTFAVTKRVEGRESSVESRNPE